MLRSTLLLTLSLLAVAPRASARLPVRWNVSATSSSAPVVVGDKVVLANGEWLRCYKLASGRLLWAKRIRGLLGETVTGDGGRVFALTRGAVLVLDVNSGNPRLRRSLAAPRSLVAAGTQLVVSDSSGLRWLDARGKDSARSVQRGLLRAIEGRKVVLYVEGKRARRGSPKKLLVIDPGQPRPALTFKLLPTGAHELLRFARGKLSFVDRCGGNDKPHKLYLTSLDLASGEKKDLSLGKLFARQQPQFGFVAGPAAVFIASFGGAAADARKTLLLSVDPQNKKVRWKRRGLLLSTGPGLFGGLGLMVGVARAGGKGALVVLDEKTGVDLINQELDSQPMWPPQVGGRCLLIQTHRSLYCLERPAGKQPTSRLARQGWRQIQDSAVGYQLSLPASWRLASKHVRKLGGKRHSLPFVRYLRRGSRWVLQGTMHLLVREAAGQDTEGFWRSVAAFRRRQDPRMRMLERRQQKLGADTALVVRYEMHNRAGAVEQWRSLCLVRGGVAYELRAWSAPLWAQQIWPEVEGMMQSFRPL